MKTHVFYQGNPLHRKLAGFGETDSNISPPVIRDSTYKTVPRNTYKTLSEGEHARKKKMVGKDRCRFQRWVTGEPKGRQSPRVEKDPTTNALVNYSQYMNINIYSVLVYILTISSSQHLLNYIYIHYLWLANSTLVSQKNYHFLSLYWLRRNGSLKE